MEEKDIKETDILEKSLQSASRWRVFSICLLIILVVLLSSIVTIIFYYEFLKSSFKLEEVQSTAQPEIQYEPTTPPVFRDLTQYELNTVIEYIRKEQHFNIRYFSEPFINSSFIYTAELHLPNKTDALDYLDSGSDRPVREAKVVMFRGDKIIPVIEEYAVGPLPHIRYHRPLISKHYQRPAPFLFRPLTKAEKREVYRLLRPFDEKLQLVLQESYEARFFDCHGSCLILEDYTPVSPIVSGEDIRKIWFWTHYETEEHIIHPVDLFILFNLEGSDVTTYRIESISYGGQSFSTAEQLLDAYMSGTAVKSLLEFPEEFEYSGVHNFKSNNPPHNNARGPLQIEPDGKRYNIHDRHVEYFDWLFDIRLSTTSGPQLLDIRYQKRRIAYEISLQEISTFHSGFHPWTRYLDILHSNMLMGHNARNVVVGVDCPMSSTFLSSTHLVENEIKTIDNAFCVFERDSMTPLRRHLNSNKRIQYQGLSDTVLVLRSIIVSGNYDFIIDYIFHHNGALEVQVTTTGYIKSSFYSIQETRYGFQLRDDVVGTHSLNAIHFKVDLDINGPSNRYETLNIEPHVINNNDWSKEPGSKYEQFKFSRQLKMTEIQTLLRHNSSSPMYHLFYNNIHKTSYNDPRAYRIQIDDSLTEVLPENTGNEASMTWSRYKMAVTQQKDDETQSSSIYSMWDSREPLVQFQSFVEDNENIIDMVRTYMNKESQT